MKGAGGVQYLYNSETMPQAEAENYCACHGGHLVSFSSADTQNPLDGLSEQKAVEKFFSDAGCLLPQDNNAYWIGLQTDAAFTWK